MISECTHYGFQIMQTSTRKRTLHRDLDTNICNFDVYGTNLPISQISKSTTAQLKSPFGRSMVTLMYTPRNIQSDPPNPLRFRRVPG